MFVCVLNEMPPFIFLKKGNFRAYMQLVFLWSSVYPCWKFLRLQKFTEEQSYWPNLPRQGTEWHTLLCLSFSVAVHSVRISALILLCRNTRNPFRKLRACNVPKSRKRYGPGFTCLSRSLNEHYEFNPEDFSSKATHISFGKDEDWVCPAAPRWAKPASCSLKMYGWVDFCPFA